VISESEGKTLSGMESPLECPKVKVWVFRSVNVFIVSYLMCMVIVLVTVDEGGCFNL
jgi:hypothetical protein